MGHQKLPFDDYGMDQESCLKDVFGHRSICFPFLNLFQEAFPYGDVPMWWNRIFVPIIFTLMFIYIAKENGWQCLWVGIEAESGKDKWSPPRTGGKACSWRWVFIWEGWQRGNPNLYQYRTGRFLLALGAMQVHVSNHWWYPHVRFETCLNDI